MDNFFRNDVKYGLHIMSAANNENIKKSRNYKVFLAITGFFKKSE